MKKLLSILLFAMILVSCEKAKWEKDSPITDDGNYIMFQGQKCPIVEVKDDMVYIKATGIAIAKKVTSETGEYFTFESISKNPIEYGFSCWCNCCGCRWSVRKENVPFSNCFGCPVGGMQHPILHPYFYAGCQCGTCNIFVIKPEE